MGNLLYFGGLDPALRVDNTALTILEYDFRTKVLSQWGDVEVWPHIHPKKIGDDLLKIHSSIRFTRIGYDRLGSGEIVQLFSPKLPMYEVISSLTIKQDIIGELKLLWDSKRLVISDAELFREISEQEKVVSDAGNILYRHPEGFHDDRFWSLGYAAKSATDYLKGKAGVGIGVAGGMTVHDLEVLTEKEINKQLGIA